MPNPLTGRTAEPALGGPTTIVDAACPLDCPDACSLAVTVNQGRIIEIDGSHRNPVTDGFICAKVRKFGERVYGPDRLLYPAIRKGRKGEGKFARATWDDALELIAERFMRAKSANGGESILPFSYGGSNGILTQDNLDAQLWRRFGTSRLARTVCAAPTGAANAALYGKMPSVVYQDYPEAKLIVLWGVNPTASGIHLVPYVRAAQKRGAALVVVDPRGTPLSRTADLHLPIKPGTDVVVALALHRYLFVNGFADESFLRGTCVGRRGASRACRAVDHRGSGRACRKSIRPRSSGSRSCTRRARRRSCAAAGASNATGTAATPRWPSWRCRRSGESSACAAADTR